MSAVTSLDMVAEIAAIAEWESTFTVAPGEVPPVTETAREQALRLMREIVAEVGPDYRYATPHGGCAYVEGFDTQEDLTIQPVSGYRWSEGRPETLAPSCIVGRVMDKIGGVELLEEVVLSGSNQEGVDGVIGYFPQEWAADGGLMYGLRMAQSWQDERVPYGAVLEAFEEVLRRCDADFVDAHHWSPDPENYFIVDGDVEPGDDGNYTELRPPEERRLVIGCYSICEAASDGVHSHNLVP